MDVQADRQLRRVWVAKANDLSRRCGHSGTDDGIVTNLIVRQAWVRAVVVSRLLRDTSDLQVREWGRRGANLGVPPHSAASSTSVSVTVETSLVLSGGQT